MDVGKAIELFTQRMQSKNWSDSTIKNYRSQVNCFLQHYKHVPKAKEISANTIEQYLLTKCAINTRNHARCGITAFYKLVINQPMKLAHIPFPKKEKKLPQPIDASDVQKLLNVCTNIKHKAIIALLYSAGLRVSEVINLKITHIDSTKNIINIICGKGKKDRQVMLDASMLQLLRTYYKAYLPKEYLFNGQFEPQYSERSINQFLKKYAALAGIKQRIHAHLLRHCFATHSLEQGTDIRIIQKLLGHNSIKTTNIYTHVSSYLIAKTTSPLAHLKL
jgi:site-specific recombinase XerD